MARRRASPPLLALTWLAFTLCVAGLTGQSLWRDEVDVLRFAAGPLNRLLQMFRDPGQNGPLFFLVIRPWLAVAGTSEFALRFPSATAATLAVPLLSILVQRLTNGRKPSLLAALLLATAPMFIWYGQEAKMYAALVALAPAALLLTIEAVRRGAWWRWGLLYLVTTLGFYIHLLAALIVPVQVVWLLILPGSAQPRPRRRRLLAAGAYLAALLAPYLPLLWWQAGMWRASGWETGHPRVSFGETWAALFGVFGRGILPIAQGWTLLPCALAFLAGVLLWRSGSANHAAADAGAQPDDKTPPADNNVKTQRRKDATVCRCAFAPLHSPIVLLLVWLLLPPLGVYIISLRLPVFAVRYLVWTLPAFFALVSLGTAALGRAWRPLGQATLAALLALNLVSLGAQSARPIKSDFRAAARYVLEHRQSADLLIYQIPYIRYTFSYYASTGRDPEEPTLRGIDGLYTNNGMDAAEVDEHMQRGAAGAQAAWLIASEAPMWDERGLTEGWLAAHGTPVRRADFERVSVTRYELKR